MKTDVASFLLEVETEWGYEIESGDTLDIQGKRHGVIGWIEKVTRWINIIKAHGWMETS